MIGTVLAPDLVKHDGKYCIYIPTTQPNSPIQPIPKKTFVIVADNIEGPWSDPVELKNIGNRIDPGHIVGEDGKRYLFVSVFDLIVPLSANLASKHAVPSDVGSTIEQKARTCCCDEENASCRAFAE